MSAWLSEHLVCPQDQTRFRILSEELVCDKAHSFPYLDGIPVLLPRDLKPTQSPHWRLLERPSGLRHALDASHEIERNNANVDPFVQDIVAATCGYLYVPLVGRLPRYPIPQLRLPIASGEHLADVGCNWGRWSISAVLGGYACVGIDPSFEAVLAARRVARQLGVVCEFLVADARRMPFADASLETVFSYSVLQHFSKPDARQAIREIRRILKDGGTALIQMPNRLGIRSLYHQARLLLHERGEFDVRYWFPTELLNAFAAIGPVRLEVDGFFGLGIQAADAELLPNRFRAVVQMSEHLRNLSGRPEFGWLRYFADSVYLRARRATAQ